jgi:hypothetical protein
MPRDIRIGLGVDDQRLGLGAVGDPHLGAVEDVAVALLLGAGLHRDHVGAGAGLGHRQPAQVLAGDQLGQIAPLLLGAAVAADLVDAEVGMGAVGEPDRGGGARDFLHRHAVLEVAEPGAAPLLLDGNAVNAELAKLRPEVAWEGIAAVDLVGPRRDLVGGEVAHAVAQHVGGLAQPEIEAADIVHTHRCRSLVAVSRGGFRPQSRVAARLMHVLDRTAILPPRDTKRTPIRTPFGRFPTTASLCHISRRGHPERAL